MNNFIQLTTDVVKTGGQRDCHEADLKENSDVAEQVEETHCRCGS
jgi:hypothetical protein